MWRVLVLVMIASLSNAQQKNPDVVAVEKSKKEGMWIRWAPGSPSVWSLGIRYGYDITRFIVTPEGEIENPLGERLNTAPIKPFDEAAFDRLSAEVKEAAVVQELLYGAEAKKTVQIKDPISALTRNRELENQLGIALLMCDLSSRVAEAAGLFFIDRTVQIGKRYIYRISLASVPKGVTIEPAIVVTDAVEEKPLFEINDLRITTFDKKVTLQWQSLLLRGVYSAFYIEKSDDGKNFRRVSDLPYIHVSKTDEPTMYYVDSLDVNNKIYHYRILGISPFGEVGPPSNIVSASGRDNFTGYLQIDEAKANEESIGRIKWMFPVELEPRISGFMVSRSEDSQGPWEDANKQIIAKNQREFSDKTPFQNTYYIVRALDHGGRQVATSLPVLIHTVDNTPPQIPSELKGTINDKGILELSWKASTDPDIMGYRVFRSNLLSEEYAEVSPKILTTPVFTDTVNISVLNRKIYYSVVAVDINYNTSEYSVPLQLLKPDVIPPAAPAFTKSFIQGDSISLAWENSPSDDIARQELIKVEKGENITRTVMSWTTSSPRKAYVDRALTMGKTYRYKIIVTDSAGNTSEAVSSEMLFETGYRKAVTALKASVKREEKNIRLEWKNPQPSLKCIIYRKKNDGALTLYQTLEGNVEAFTDKSINMNNTYVYKIQPVFTNGVKSVLSDEVVVKY